MRGTTSTIKIQTRVNIHERSSDKKEAAAAADFYKKEKEKHKNYRNTIPIHSGNQKGNKKPTKKILIKNQKAKRTIPATESVKDPA